jgi:tetratricopeptide (TPR) repeat protein
VRRGAPLDGIAAARRAVAMLEPIGAEDPYSLARATSLLGQTLYGTRMHQQAVPVLEKSIALNQTLDPVDTKQLAADLDNLGNALMALGETDRGLEQLERSVAVLEEAGADPALMANGLTRLGLCQLDAGRVEEARASLTRSRPFATEAAGNGHHTEVADVESAWATYWTAMGDLDEATACLRRAAAETEAVYGMEHPRTAMISLRLGTALQEAGQPHEALDRLRLGREILAATAAGHLGHLQAFDLPTARVLIDLGRFQGGARSPGAAGRIGQYPPSGRGPGTPRHAGHLNPRPGSLAAPSPEKEAVDDVGHVRSRRPSARSVSETRSRSRWRVSCPFRSFAPGSQRS